MSFLSNVLPLWNKATSSRVEGQTDQVDSETQELSLTVPERCKHAKREVKLPSVPLDLSNDLTQTPSNTEGRSLSRNLMRMTELEEKCWFCSGQTCQATSKDAPPLTERTHENARRQPQPRKRHQRQELINNPNSSRNVNHQDIKSPRSQKFSQADTGSQELQVSSTFKGISLKDKSLGWEPFTKACQYCGLKFGSLSVAIHERRCSQRQQQSRKPLDPRQTTHLENTHGDVSIGFHQKVGTIVTVGLDSGLEKVTLYTNLPPRPQTRTISNSTLHASGFGLPLAADQTAKEVMFQDSSSSVLCKQCNQVVAVDQMSIHRRLCKPKANLLSRGNVTFPTVCDSLCTKESSNLPKKEQTTLRVPQKPPTKQCYICGREFGSRSIDIHEPQCMKKWQIENRKLPISERKAVPKKPESKPTILSAASSIMIPPTNVCADDTTDKSVQRYFMNCYSEFERDLVPCKRCGRTFAPDRHRLHEQHCNAKPIHSKKLMTNTKRS